MSAMARIVFTNAQQPTADIMTNMAAMFKLQQQDALQREGATKDDLGGIKRTMATQDKDVSALTSQLHLLTTTQWSVLLGWRDPIDSLEHPPTRSSIKRWGDRKATIP